MDQSTLPQPLRLITLVLSHGHFGVVAFIVLSGFSLMLPMAQAGTTHLVGGFRGYIRRRGRRILPGYYVALVFSIFLLIGYHLLGDYRLANIEPSTLTFGSVLSHLLLVHNASYDFVFRINGPMWTVATEWQIYFIFALVLLPLLRRTNILVVVVVAWVVSSLPWFLLPSAHSFFWAAPWLLGSFAIGMLGAIIGFSPAWRDSVWRTRCPWGGLAMACMAAVALLVVTKQADTLRGPFEDLFESLCGFCIINACWVPTARSSSAPEGRLAKLLGSRQFVYLGAFSYSLYLVQYPILQLTERLFAKAGLSRTATIVGHLVLVVPLIVAFAWIFSKLFERPFSRSGALLPALRRHVGQSR